MSNDASAETTPAQKVKPKQPTKGELRDRVAELEAALEAKESEVAALTMVVHNSEALQALVNLVGHTEVEAAAPPKQRTPLLIRNCRSSSVNLRLKDPGQRDRPFRINLRPRGHRGDTAEVPAHLSDHTDLNGSIEVGLVEVITQAQSDSITRENFTYSADDQVARERVGDESSTVRAFKIEVGEHGEVKETDFRQGQTVRRSAANPTQVQVPGSQSITESTDSVMPELKPLSRERVN